MNLTITSVLPLLTLCLIIACGNPSTSPPQTTVTDPYEADDASPEIRTLTKDGTTLQRALTPGDTDYVRYSCDAQDTLYVTAEGSLSINITLYLQKGTSPLRQSATAESVSLTYPVLSTTSYTIMIIAGDSSAEGSYSITASLREKSGTVQQIGNDKFEPDNKRSDANLITTFFSASHKHTLPSGDTDWIAIRVQENSTYTCTISGTTEPLSVSGYLSSDSLVFSNENMASAEAAITPHKDDTLYIRITSLFSVYSYTFAVTEKVPTLPDSFENDNEKSAAQLITASSVSDQRHTLPSGDTDWIAIPAQKDYYYACFFSGTTEPISVSGFLSDGSHFFIQENVASATARFTPSTDDTLYFRVTSLFDVYSYAFSMTSEEPMPPDTFEIDNSIDQAIKTSGDFTQEHTITPGDTDWIAIPGSAGSSCMFSINTSSCKVSLYTKDGLIGVLPSQDAIYTAETDDTLYCLITGRNKSTSVSYEISLVVTSPPEPDMYEVDNTIGTATTHPLDSSVQVRTIMANDTDFVTFTGEAGDQLVFEITLTMANLNHVTLYDSAGTVLKTGKNDRGGVTIIHTLPYNGTYYCCVTGDGSSEYSYTLIAYLNKHTVLPAGGSLSGYHWASDSTWEGILMDTGYTYTLALSEKQGLVMELHDSLHLSTVLASAETASSDMVSLQYTPVRPGLFFLLILGVNEMVEGRFSLEVSRERK